MLRLGHPAAQGQVSPRRPVDQEQTDDVPRLPWGVPDLQGVWDYRTATPLERPEALAGKRTLSDEEAARFEAAFAQGPGGGNFSQLPSAVVAVTPPGHYNASCLN